MAILNAPLGPSLTFDAKNGSSVTLDSTKLHSTTFGSPLRPRKQASAKSAPAYAMDSVAEPCHGSGTHVSTLVAYSEVRQGESPEQQAVYITPYAEWKGLKKASMHLAGLGLHHLSAAVLRALGERVDLGVRQACCVRAR